MVQKLRPQMESLYGTPSPMSLQNPPPVVANRAPTTADTGYSLGQMWVYQPGGAIYALSSVSGGAADWEVLGGSGSDVNTLTADTGGQILPLNGNIDLIGGTGISTVGTASSITFNVTGAGIEYTVVTSDTQMAVNQGYVANKAGTATVLTLPTPVAVGSIVSVVGLGATGWSIAQNALQTISINSVSTTAGPAGSLASSARYNSVQLLCTVNNIGWTVINSEGTLTVT